MGRQTISATDIIATVKRRQQPQTNTHSRFKECLYPKSSKLLILFRRSGGS